MSISGDVVKAGTVLAEIEKSDYEFRLRQSEALINQTRARLGILDKQGDAVTPEETAIVNQAAAELKEARFIFQTTDALAKEGVLSKIDLEKAGVARDAAEAAYQASLEQVMQLRAAVGRAAGAAGAGQAESGGLRDPRAVRWGDDGAHCIAGRISGGECAGGARWCASTRCGCGWKCRSGRRPRCASGSAIHVRLEGVRDHAGRARGPHEPGDRRAEPVAAGGRARSRTREACCGRVRSRRR